MKKLLFKNLLSFALVLIGAGLFAQNSVSGVVRDADNGEALIGVNILVVGTVSGTISDLDGSYTLTTTKELPYQLTFSLVGFGSQTVTVSENGQSIDVSLGTESIVANEIVVSASRVEESILQSPVTIEKLDLLALQQSTSSDYYDEISKLKGVHHTQASVTFNSINARGFAAHGNTRFIQLQDGIDNAAPLLNFPTGSIVGIPDLDIKNIEMIPGAASALYGPNAFNGILIMNSKSPFNYQGLSVQLKSGMTDGVSTDPYYGGSIRYAKAFNDKFAFKVNASLLQAQDWEANDYETQRAPDPFAAGSESFFGGATFDGINAYGDEVPIPVGTGLKRTGWNEEDLLDNRDAKSLKLNGALFYRINDNIEANFSYQWGSGSSVYQGSERYALRDLVQTFTKFELNSDKWNIRAYRSKTDDGDSYNMTALGAFVNEGIFPTIFAQDATFNYQGQDVTIPLQGGWAVAANLWNALPGSNAAAAKAFADAGGFSSLPMSQWEQLSGVFGPALFGGLNPDPEFQRLAALELFKLASGEARPEVGSARFNELLEGVRTGLFQRGGAGFIDDSHMDHVEGQYDLSEAIGGDIGLQVGGNFRRYSLFTDGTVFNEDPEGTGVNERINISEYGVYTQASKSLMDDRLKLKGSIRYDKNENFDGQFSPRISVVYSAGENKNHNFRVSYQTGFRNPTTQGQYIYFPTSNILLGGTRENAERYGIYEGGAWSEASYAAYLGSGSSAETRDESLLVEQYLDYVRPEKLKTYEIGYKGMSNNKLFVDVVGYYNIYNDFITQNNVISKNDTEHKGNLVPAGTTWRPYFNAPVDISSYGVSLSTEYLIGDKKNWKLSANYTFNDFDVADDLPTGFEQYDPSFNTPRNKFNIGLSNRKIIKNLSGGVSYRWQEEHFFTSSFGEGTIPAYQTLDAQIGYKLSEYKTTIKLGATNILKDIYRTNYGGPFIGRMIHLTLTYDQFAN